MGFLVGDAVAVAVSSNTGVAEACACGDSVINGRAASFIEERYPSSNAAIATTRMASIVRRVKGLSFIVHTPVCFDPTN